MSLHVYMPVCMCARKSERRVSVSEYMCVSMHLLANVKISIPMVCFLYLIYISGFISVGCSWPLYIAVYMFVCGWNEHECKVGLRRYPCGFLRFSLVFMCIFCLDISSFKHTRRGGSLASPMFIIVIVPQQRIVYH